MIQKASVIRGSLLTARSENVEVVRGDDSPSVELVQLGEHARLGVSRIAEPHLMCEDQQAGATFCRNLGELFRRSVEAADVLAPARVALLVSLFGVDLMDENVAAIARGRDIVGGTRIAGHHDRAIGSLEFVAEGVLPRSMRNREG